MCMRKKGLTVFCWYVIKQKTTKTACNSEQSIYFMAKIFQSVTQSKITCRWPGNKHSQINNVEMNHVQSIHFDRNKRVVLNNKCRYFIQEDRVWRLRSVGYLVEGTREVLWQPYSLYEWRVTAQLNLMTVTTIFIVSLFIWSTSVFLNIYNPVTHLK